MEHRNESEHSGQPEAASLPGGLPLPLEVRVHGRGGQGGVTCAKLIAALYANMGLYVQTFGDYGSERSGAPVQAFTRVDHRPITNRNKVYRPDHLIVLDPGLMGSQVLSGVAPGALLLLNTSASLDEFGGQYAEYRFGIVDATEIAREQGIGSSSVVIINTTIVGAYARLLGVSMSVLEQAYASLGLVDDLVAARQAYERVKVQEPAEDAGGQAAVGIAAGIELQVVIPVTGLTMDIPAGLKTGSWSNQAPVYREYTAPCNAACPAGNDVVGFIQALKHDGPEAAAALLLRTQALPSVCGRVCPAPCMRECNRGAFDGAVNIRSLERWISDQSVLQPVRETAANPRRVAVVGGGPAGLSAAYQLALRGHGVTIYEAGPALGGVLLNGIPAFRLPLDVLNRDIGRILSLGVEVQYDRHLGREDLERLEHDYDAVIVSTGFGRAHVLSADGEKLEGVEQGLDFLDRAKQGKLTVAGQVVVVGGGNTAIDCARSALRSGATTVTLVYRRGREEMPAIKEEIEDAEREGVRLMLHRQPVSFSGDGHLSAVMLAEVEEGPPDGSGRRRPVITKRTATLACDKVLLALGQQTDVELLPEAWQMRDSRAWRGEQPLQIWFAGDCATGEGTVTHAIGNGRRIAQAALAALAGEPAAPLQEPPRAVVAPAQIRFSHFEVVPPRKDRHLPLATARNSFAEFNLGLAGPEEAERCFSCGQCTKCDTCLIYCPDGVVYRSGDGYRVDEEYCKGCGMCVAECPRYAMEMKEKTSRR